MLFSRKLFFVLAFYSLSLSSVCFAVGPISCLKLASLLSDEWKSVEIEVPLTEKLMRDFNTTDGTIGPLIASVGPGARSQLAKMNKLFLLDHPDRNWSVLTYEERRDLLTALYSDVSLEVYHENRRINGLVFDRSRLAGPNSPAFENYVEWANPYNSYLRDVEVEIHIRSWDEDPKVALKAAEAYTREVTGKKLPVHFQRVALSPTLYHPDDLGKGIEATFAFLALYAQASMLFELSIVQKGHHLSDSREGAAINFSPLRMNLLDLTIRFLARKLSKQEPDEIDEDAIGGLSGFVQLKLPGFYKNKDLTGFEFRVVNDGRFPQVEKYITASHHRLNDPMYGFSEDFFEFFRDNNPVLFNGLKLGEDHKSIWIRSAILDSMFDGLSAYSGKSVTLFLPFLDNNSLVDLSKVKPLLDKGGNAEINSKTQKYFSLYMELRYLFTNYEKNYYLHKNPSELKSLQTAQKRAIERFVELVATGQSPSLRQSSREVTSLMRQFLIESDLVKIVERDFEQAADVAAARYSLEHKRK